MYERNRLIEFFADHCAVYAFEACPKSSNGKCTIMECATCLADDLIAKGARVMEIDYRSSYDFIMALQGELEAQHHDAEIGCLDYKAVKALAATYELQDYLANRIAKAVANGELDPDPED